MGPEAPKPMSERTIGARNPGAPIMTPGIATAIALIPYVPTMLARFPIAMWLAKDEFDTPGAAGEQSYGYMKKDSRVRASDGLTCAWERGTL